MNKTLLPVDINLPERTLLNNGAMFVVLRTLDELDDFRKNHHHLFQFAAQPRGLVGQPYFLNEYEWVFAPSKASLVNAFCRWDQIGIKCQWYDWATDEPAEHAGWFTDRQNYRAEQIARNRWSITDEREYTEDCIKRTTASYRGWWVLTNLPGGMCDSDWFEPFGHEEIIDRNLSPDHVATLMQELTFDAWNKSDCSELECFKEEDIDRFIAYWRAEQHDGAEYYGAENETMTR